MCSTASVSKTSHSYAQGLVDGARLGIVRRQRLQVTIAALLIGLVAAITNELLTRR